MNPRVIRIIWLCFAVGLDIWGKESRMYWPNDLFSIFLNNQPTPKHHE
jgi:hypothetical protein